MTLVFIHEANKIIKCYIINTLHLVVNTINILAETEEDLEELLPEVVRIRTKQYNMRINRKNSKLICAFRNNSKVTITLGGETKKFVIWVASLTEDGRSKTERIERIF